MIDRYEFGKFIVNKKEYKSNITITGEDAREHRHLEDHKIRLDDFARLLAYNPNYIVIGTGAYGVVKVPKEIIEYIEKRNIKVIVEKTEEACKKYNELLLKGNKVAGFFHNTC